jgi:methionine-rich copper-binding protein CopC
MAPTHALANTLTTSSPAAGAVLGVAPNAVSVTGTTTLSDQGSTISVTDPTGLQVDDGSVTITDTTAVIGLKPLVAPGVYTVTYSLVSATDAPLTGSYTFLFNAPAAVASATPTPTQSVTVVPASKGTHTADIFVIILMLFALLVGLFLLWYARLLLRERKANKRKSRSKSTPKRPKIEKEDRQ